MHDLRHSLASFAADAEVDIARLQAQLGHSDVSMTLRYVHQAVAPRRAAMDMAVAAMMDAGHE